MRMYRAVKTKTKQTRYFCLTFIDVNLQRVVYVYRRRCSHGVLGAIEVFTHSSFISRILVLFLRLDCDSIGRIFFMC